MSDWREKIKALTSTMGPIGDAVFKEIEESVEEAIGEAYEEGAHGERIYRDEY